MTGYIAVRAYASIARYPLENVAIAVTASDGTALAMRLTDRSGLIAPIAIPVPDKQDSLRPDPPEIPFTTVDLYAHLQGYEQVEAQGIQVFPDTTTEQDLEMIPLAEFPDYFDQRELFQTPPQNL